MDLEPLRGMLSCRTDRTSYDGTAVPYFLHELSPCKARDAHVSVLQDQVVVPRELLHVRLQEPKLVVPTRDVLHQERDP